MPIRLNLLAEAQATEEMRRRDPVKRAVWVGASLAAVMLAWSAWLQCRAMVAKGEVSKIQSQMHSFTNEYALVLDNKRKGDEILGKVSALDKLTSARFLHATVLNALQTTSVDDVQLLRYRCEQLFAMTDGVKPKTNGDHVTPGRPATVTEKVAVTLEGNDSSANPGDQVTRFKEALAKNEYFKEALGGRPNAVSLKSLGQPEFTSSGRRGVYFTLECRYPEITR
jgi:hypothetical protein